MQNRNVATWWWVAVGTLALAVALFTLPRPGAPGRDADGPVITDVSARRITPGRAEKLPVYRVVAAGEAVNLAAPGRAEWPVLRVDFEVEGKHVTVWVRDAAAPRPHEHQ
jgi:hypothetical protein